MTIVLNALSVVIWCGYLQIHERCENKGKKLDGFHIQAMCSKTQLNEPTM
jgi:hypothetical protein